LLLSFLLFFGFENEILTSDAFVDIKYVVASGFEVGGGIVGGGDENLVLGTIFNWLERVHYAHELLGNGTEEVKCRLELLDGVACFHGGRHNSYVLALGNYVVGEGNAPYVDIRTALHLLLRNDNLTRIGIVCIGNGVVKDADSSDDLPGLLHFVREVGWIRHHELAFGHLALRLDSYHHSVFVYDLVDRFVKHICTAVNGTETSKGLRELSKPIERIDVGGFGVLGKRFRV